MHFQFSDKIREGFEQSIDEDSVKFYIHGVGIVVVKMAQLKIVQDNEYAQRCQRCQKTTGEETGQAILDRWA